MKPDPEILLEAVKDLHKDETIERALGRVLRRYGGRFETDYQRIIGDVRDLARREKITTIEAARKLAKAQTSP